MSRLVVAINDDATQNNVGDAAVLTNATKVFGTLSTNAEFIGLRFVNVAVGNAATIRHAYLKVHLSSITGSTASYSLNGEDADNSAAFAAAANDISGRTLTTAATTSEIHDLADGYRYFDVTSIVQEIVDRAGWTLNNAMAFIFNTPSLSAVATISMVESANDPELAIIYGDSTDGVRSPTVSGSGGFTDPDNAFSSNDIYATAANAASVAQIWESFNIASLTGSTIDGILLQVEAKVSSTASRSEYTVELSWDGGTTWTTAKRSFQFQATDRTYSYGGADLWSHTFIPSELTNANFKVRVTTDFASATNDASIDAVTVQVFYTNGVSQKIIMVKQAVNRASTY